MLSLFLSLGSLVELIISFSRSNYDHTNTHAKTLTQDDVDDILEDDISSK